VKNEDLILMGFLREKAGADGYCYRTGDSVKKVVAFYHEHPGVTPMGSVKVPSPWQPAKGGEMKKNTTIVITRE
jgi:hypothetical protein